MTLTHISTVLGVIVSIDQAKALNQGEAISEADSDCEEDIDSLVCQFKHQSGIELYQLTHDIDEKTPLFLGFGLLEVSTTQWLDSSARTIDLDFLDQKRIELENLISHHCLSGDIRLVNVQNDCICCT